MNTDNFSLDQSPPPAVTQDAVGFAVLECNRLHSRSQEAIAQGVAFAVILGYQLTKLKNGLPHGQFGKLFKGSKLEPRFQFGQRQANKVKKIYRLLTTKLNEDDRSAFIHRCEVGDVDPVAHYMATKFPGIDSIRAALNVLDDSKKETAEYDPNQFDHDAPTDEEASPMLQGVLFYQKCLDSYANLESYYEKHAASISIDNRRILANNLKTLADKLVSL